MEFVKNKLWYYTDILRNFVTHIFTKNQTMIIAVSFVISIALVILFFIGNDFGVLTNNTDLKNRAASVIKLTDAEAEEYWRKYIVAVGEVDAYKEFIKLEEHLPDGAEHKRAHLFGGALYNEKGIDFFSICDSRFHYGCLHEFIEKAVSEHGDSVITTLSNKCIDKFGKSGINCQHGIGHNILSYIGYDLESLKESLETCNNPDSINSKDPFRGCEGGVYMEFNMYTIISGEDGVRYLDDPLFPCADISQDHKSGCIFWQTQWWQEVLHRNYGAKDSESDAKIYTTMGNYCREFTTDVNLLQVCFAGIGNFGSGGVDYNLSDIIDLCDNAASGDQELNLFCRLRGVVKSPSEKLKNQTVSNICEGLNGNVKEYCISFITNKASLDFTTKDGMHIHMPELLYSRFVQ